MGPDALNEAIAILEEELTKWFKVVAHVRLGNGKVLSFCKHKSGWGLYLMREETSPRSTWVHLTQAGLKDRLCASEVISELIDSLCRVEGEVGTRVEEAAKTFLASAEKLKT